MRIPVDVGVRVLEEPTLAKVAEDLIGSLNSRCSVQPAVLRQEAPALVDGDEHGQVVHLRELEVLRAGARCDVDDAGPLLERDVVPGDDAVHDRLRGLEVVVRALVLEPDQVGTAHAFHEGLVGEAFDGDPLAGVLSAVLGVGIDRGGDVRRQCPRRRRPDDERLPVTSLQREADEERRIRLVAVDVGLRQLVLRDRRAAARAPLGRAVSLVQRAALVQCLQEPPDVLDVRVAEGVVVVPPVHPLAEPDRLTRDDARRLCDQLAATARELVDPVLLDLRLRVEAEFPLDLDLDPQPLTVEPVLVALVETLHRLVALEQILVRAAPEMVDAQPVGRVRRLRAVEEAPVRSASVAFAEPVEDPLLVPPGEDLLLEGGVIWILGERLEHGVILGSRGNLPVSPNPFPWSASRTGGSAAGRNRRSEALHSGYDR